MQTILILGEGDDSIHFPMLAKNAGDPMTLCGFCDVMNNSELSHEDHPVTCRACIAKVEAIKKFRLPKGWKA